MSHQVPYRAQNGKGERFVITRNICETPFENLTLAVRDTQCIDRYKNVCNSAVDTKPWLEGMNNLTAGYTR